MADVERYVDTASAGGDGTTENHSGATAAYASLASWESSEQADLVTATQTHRVRCAGSTADAGSVTINGWTESSTYFLTIEANRTAADSDGFYSGPDLISNSHYRLEYSTFAGIYCNESYTVIDGLQVRNTGNTDEVHGIIGIGTSVRIYRCRVLSDQTTASNQVGIGSDIANRGNIDVEIDSNIIVNFNIGVHEQIANASGNRYIRNNTVYLSSATGINFVANVANVKFTAENNIVFGTVTAGGDYSLSGSGSGSATVTTDTNAFEDSEGTTNEVSLSGITASEIWTSPGTGIGADFSLLNGSVCTNAGISTGETTDVYDVTRTSPYDIGAVDNAFIGGGPSMLPLLGVG